MVDATVIRSQQEPNARLWEVTALLKGAHASRNLMMSLTLPSDAVQNLKGKKCVIRGSRNHVFKKILKESQEIVAKKEIGQFSTRNQDMERQFWSEVAIADYLKECKYILKL